MAIDLNRSTNRRCSIKKVFLKTSQNSLENTRTFYFRKFYFPVNFAKFLRKHFLQSTSGLLPLPQSNLFILKVRTNFGLIWNDKCCIPSLFAFLPRALFTWYLALIKCMTGNITEDNEEVLAWIKGRNIHHLHFAGKHFYRCVKFHFVKRFDNWKTDIEQKSILWT